ncbi:NifB/NifX family molybdenum-iron cluster-binding protein [Methanobacterium formicicum]|uniref:Dinitrogenase iron-molybdenum cofactor biosynthesis protein n=1 Tax=Methanobacterium formicicum (strain DSM 3637 / PP1) TaxID=1204725 RepID=K2QBQ4_METFP|nr:NifB/NifX family molybdenum-iron cluster-binding protein [Methanobacterium formicicum]EKF85351.1 dinitrogenase iron-molybdenum cofactor biosynthesis protein [Methanobacterium formicicum DSM 3637]
MSLICVPSLSNEGLQAEVSQHLGKTPYFVLIKWENDQIEKFQVLESGSKHLGGRMTPGEFIAGSGANILLCGNLGQKAVQMIEKAGIEVYVGASGTVMEALQSWVDSKLKPATMDTVCADGH